ncbi:sensor histidine kinase [Cohnella sp. GCM10020058]|uniref:cache domain-containing sensor histidine kinase n=1 Tax=Cohnella sp. GCM10020058 TaxID=3317330 RepID=UPI003638AC5A
MKKRYFIKHLATFVIPLLIPLLILGSVSFFTSQHEMKADINRSSQFLLTQSQRQIEMILDELDTLNLALYQNAKVFNELANVLRSPSYSYESSSAYQIISGYMTALTSSKPYIQSVYFYIDNPNGRFLSSVDGLSTFAHATDTAWFDEFMAYDGPPHEWTTRRLTKQLGMADTVTISNVISARHIGIFLNIRPQYIESILRSITTYDGQKLLVLDENDEIVFSNVPSASLSKSELRRVARETSPFFDMETAGGKENVTQVESARYKWKYVSIIPHSSLYRTPSRILSFTIVSASLSFVLGLLLTYYLTRRNYRQLLAITTLIRSAENNRAPLKSPVDVRDEYAFITQNIVKHFIEHRFVETQLSEKKYRLQAMELQALQAQINPHFLYNTLHSIYWESVGLTGKPNKASEMIEQLSDILSYSFSNPNERVTWEAEIANTINYVSIQKQRYKNLFDVIFEYEEDIRGLTTMKLLLQPLIENSIYHGLREKPGGGLIKVKIWRRADALRITVIDNGIGMAHARLSEIRRRLRQPDDAAAHIGLRNTHKRLALMYNEMNLFRILSKPGLGTVVSIVIPAAPPVRR